MEIATIVIIVLASLTSALTMHFYDRNKDGKITKEEISETVKEAIEKIIKK